MALVKMGKQGRIVIPSEIRSRLDFDEGDELRARVEDGRLVLESPSAALATVRKKLSEGAKARSLTDELIERRSAESGLGQAHLER
jgi:AbrB family looped-hinge helix DNA binding protein